MFSWIWSFPSMPCSLYSLQVIKDVDDICFYTRLNNSYLNLMLVSHWGHCAYPFNAGYIVVFKVYDSGNCIMLALSWASFMSSFCFFLFVFYEYLAFVRQDVNGHCASNWLLHSVMHRQDIPEVRKSVNNERKLEHVDGAQLKANLL